MGGTEVRFDILGPLRARSGATELTFGPLQQRLVLAALVLHANRPLGRDQLIDMVWGPTAPAFAVNLLQKHISNLRRVLAPVRSAGTPSQISWTPAGYLLTVATGAVDLHEFDCGVDRATAARAAGDLTTARDALRDAVRLCRGPAYDGLSSPLLDAFRDAFAERLIGVVEQRIEVGLALGNHLDLVAELRRLVAEHPLRESLRVHLMAALYRSGRQAEALTTYHEARRCLHDELGVDPGSALQEMHLKVLNADASLTSPTPPAAIAAPLAVIDAPAAALAGHDRLSDRGHQMPTPAQLPHGMPDFVGRGEELRRLTALVPLTRDTMVIATISGTAGVGKSALAIHWAHRIRAEFPDGQLYVNLKGFDQGGRPLDPANAITGFLSALSVPAQRIPVGPDAQAALYRSLLADRRLLVVLDNAADADQVRMLLPGSAGSLVVVTSRHRLPGLVAAGAHALSVDLLSTGDARRFLTRRIGPQRVAAEPVAVEDIIARCAHLPLALAVAAARAATYPGLPLAAFAAELNETRGRLDAFEGGDVGNDVRSVFSWSYQRLSPTASELFRLLSVHPGAELSTSAAASLGGLTPGRARGVLAELTRAHLIAEQAPGRFAIHDLLRAYAGELATLVDTEEQRTTAAARVLEHYVRTAHLAHGLLNPLQQQPTLDPTPQGVHVVDLAAPQAAMSWFTVEHHVLLAVLDEAAATGCDAQVTRLARTLATFLHRRGQWSQLATVRETALAATVRSGDGPGRADAHRGLGRAFAWVGRQDDAETQFLLALDMFADLADLTGQAHSHLNIAWLRDRQRRYREALEHSQRALTLFRTAGLRTGQANALNAVGWFQAQLGDPAPALGSCQQALDIHREIGHREGEAHTLDSLGYIHQLLRQHAQATTSYVRAIDMWRYLGDRYYEAETLTRLGDAYRTTGDVDAAGRAWRQALLILNEYRHPSSRALMAKIAGLGIRDDPIRASRGPVLRDTALSHQS